MTSQSPDMSHKYSLPVLWLDFWSGLEQDSVDQYDYGRDPLWKRSLLLASAMSTSEDESSKQP